MGLSPNTQECMPQNIISFGDPAMLRRQPRVLPRINGPATAFFSINVRLNATICCGFAKRIFLPHAAIYGLSPKIGQTLRANRYP